MAPASSPSCSRRAVRGGHQPDREPDVHPGAPVRVLGEDDAPQPAVPARAWVREQCPGPGVRCTNIIAGDFIRVDTFVSDVIRLNDKLLRC